MNIHIPVAIQHLVDNSGLNVESYGLTQSIPPHTIQHWDGPDPQPTESELQAAYDIAVASHAISELRRQRNKLLSESDWTQNRDVTLANDSAWATYRQALRDLPSNSTPTLDSGLQLDMSSVTWPTKPS